MEWMDLKYYLAPTFMKEVDSISERYMSILLFIYII